MDEIFVEGLRLYGYHGCNKEEKQKGQYFIIDVKCKLDTVEGCYSDDIEDTVSYSKIIKKIRDVFNEDKYNLIEKVAQRITEVLFDEFNKINSIELTLKKPYAPINAEFGSVGVKIYRNRKE